MALGTEITLTIEGKAVKVGVLRMGDLLNLQKWVKKAWPKPEGPNPNGTMEDRYRGVIDAVVGPGAALAGLPADVVERHLRESRQAALGHMQQMEVMRREQGSATPGAPPHFMTAEWGQSLLSLDGGLEELAATVLPRCNPGMAREEAIASLNAMDMEQGADFFAACFGYADAQDDEGPDAPKEAPTGPPAPAAP